jgi:hypothetical protein
VTVRVGDHIFCTGGLAVSNGMDYCPAVVTHVWGVSDGVPSAVNVTLFRDNAEPALASSVALFFTEADARAASRRDEGYSHCCAFVTPTQASAAPAPQTLTEAAQMFPDPAEPVSASGEDVIFHPSNVAVGEDSTTENA